MQNVFHLPLSVGDASGLGRGLTLQGLVGSAEVVDHQVQGHSMDMVDQLLSEGIGPSGISSDVYSHGEVLPFHIAGRGSHTITCAVRALR